MTHENLNGIEAAKLISNTISKYNIGAYAYAFCEYNDENKLVIYSGSKGSHSKVTISGSAASVFGFNEYVSVNGIDPASGFDYASSRMLTSLEINKLVDGVYDDFAYVHDTDQFAVEAGRRDFNQISPSQLIEDETNYSYSSFVSKNNTIVDLSHPINNNGRLNTIYVSGIATDKSKVKILRQHSNGDLEVIYTFNFPQVNDNYLYTTRPNVYRIDCNVLVEKGDLIGIYDVNLYVGKNLSNLPDATFLVFNGEVSGRVDRKTAEFYAFGLGGFAVYARSDRRQTNVILDIDLGERVNVGTVDIFGREESECFEYNVALCLDVAWEVNLFDGTHYHSGFNWANGTPWAVTHRNIAYGIECLDDGIVTADNGHLGTVYFDNGLATNGPHSYFYVNGDAEWLYSSECDGKHEFCWPNVPYTDHALNFERDPIEFTLKFPDELPLDIHKSVIYFKERNNFRQLELSYYMGFYAYDGNTYDPKYNRIPEYTLIKMDGLPQYNTDEYPTAKYLYSNPMDDTIYYQTYVGTDAYDPVNPDVIEAAMASDWLILEHNFEPISCKGFRIYTNKHYSTKITEIEVYSRMFMSASLLDNIILSFSSYGDVWTTANFEKINDKQISAFIGGSPQFFRLELVSVGKFYLNEISAFVDDQVKLDKCDDIVLLEEAKSNLVNKASTLTLTNVYGKTLDLVVDIPNELYNVNDVLFWSRLNSWQSINEPNIGPKALLYKSSDYEIRNNNRQCAINVPAYGLKNLVDGKDSYITYNEGISWEYFKTLSSGIEIGLSNLSSLTKSVISFSVINNADFFITIPGTSDIGLSKAYIGFDDNYYDCTITSGINYEFDALYSNNFKINLNFTEYHSYSGDNLTISSGVIMVDSYGGSGSGWIDGPYAISNTFSDVYNFDFGCRFRLYRSSFYCMGIIELIFLDVADNEIFKFTVGDYWVGFDIVEYILYDKSSQLVSGMFTDNGDLNYSFYLGRDGNKLSCYFRNNEIYNGICNTDKINKIKILFKKFGNYPQVTEAGVLFTSYRINFNLLSAELVDNIHLYHYNPFYFTPTYFVYDGNEYVIDTTEQLNQTFYLQLAIDLLKRHELAIIRNYGNCNNILFLNDSILNYSNMETNDIYNVVWNGNRNDARWVKINILCGDDSDRNICKLGIYPNIETVFCKGGGYNCEWEPLGKILSDYTKEQNVAYQATVTGTNLYSLNFYPTNAVDGISTDYSMDACWGFEKRGTEDPYLELDFGNTYRINRVVLYHSYDTVDDNYMNKDYTISVSPTVTGSFSQVASIAGNNSFYSEHEFSPVNARRLRLTITNYDTTPTWFYNKNNNSYELFEGSFLREVEVYTVQDETHINSEDWPIVCMNLLDQFDVTDHQLINSLENNNDNWDNNEIFFKYSDNIFDDPQKVSFTQDGEYKIQYQKTDSSGNRAGEEEYVFDTAVYFDAGNYYVEWDSYEANLENEVSLRLDGVHIIDDFADVVGGGWIHQTGVIVVPEAGFYDVKAVRHIGGDIGSSDASWGARNPIIYRPVGLKKWIAVTRDTATNYSWDNDSNKYGKDYLSLIKVYGDTKYNPTEYSWWWNSTISNLSNNSIMVKEGSRSLQINYPTSSGIDIVEFIEGDSFGQDINFNIKDFLTFWVYIDDVSKLDLAFGGITFGIINDINPIYYGWNLNKLSLNNGWNYVRLKFEEYDFIYPARSQFDALNDYLYDDLNFRTNNKEFSSIRIRYRGKGESFTWYIDSFKIERNKFDDDVKFGKGLCLTGKEYLEIPISNINLEKGSIEFYLKLNTDTFGVDIFNQIASRPLFSLLNNNNEIVSLSIKSASWFDVTVGDIREDMHSFNVELDYLTSAYLFSRGNVIHLALVWDNEGIYMDNGDTIRFYINGELICASKTKWNVTDTKTAILKLGGAMPVNSLNYDSYCDSIFHNVKIYNYCKTNFDVELEGINKEELICANNFLEISPDGTNFYGVGSSNLPLVWKNVADGESRTIYIRTNKTGVKSLPFCNASLIIDWKMPV